MKNKKPIFKWMIAILALLVAGLFYAVYFTAWGKPESSGSAKNITTYNQTAVPTTFAKETQAPTVGLDWAYASQNLLKIAVKIRGLEVDVDPRDWICDPYIVTDKPVQRQLRLRNFRSIYDASGKFIQAAYEYEVNAGGYDSLTVDLDLTIGPCADSLNFQETSVTPTIIPLIGNYHLRFRVPIRITAPTPLPESTAVTVWNGIPIYPGAYQLDEGNTFYTFIVKDTPENIETFYNDKMASDGWEKFDRVNMKINNRRGIDLYFSKSERIITISILVPSGDEWTTVSVIWVQ